MGRNKIRLLQNQLKYLIQSKGLTFEIEDRNKAKFSGVYAILNKKEIIYIGQSKAKGGIKRRMGELLHDYRSHTLHRKLIKELKTKEKVQNFLFKECKFKALKLDNKEISPLEHFAIAILQPKYND